MYYDTHDRNEGVDGVEKRLVAIILFLHMLNWSFCINFIKEMGDGSELVGSELARRVVGASVRLAVKTHAVGLQKRATTGSALGRNVLGMSIVTTTIEWGIP